MKNIDISKRFVIFSCVFLILAWNVALYFQHPSQSELDLVQKFVSDCNSQNCSNDWQFGWWITALGGETQSKAGPPNPDFNLLRPVKVLTSQTLFDCKLITAEGIINYYWCN